MTRERKIMIIEARLQAIKEIASNACSDNKDYENIADFCDEIYSLVNEERGKMLICPECGLDVHSDYKTCPRCGAKVR